MNPGGGHEQYQKIKPMNSRGVRFGCAVRIQGPALLAYKLLLIHTLRG
jgi:hypothetical protein